MDVSSVVIALAFVGRCASAYFGEFATLVRLITLRPNQANVPPSWAAPLTSRTGANG